MTETLVDGQVVNLIHVGQGDVEGALDGQALSLKDPIQGPSLVPLRSRLRVVIRAALIAAGDQA